MPDAPWPEMQITDRKNTSCVIPKVTLPLPPGLGDVDSSHGLLGAALEPEGAAGSIVMLHLLAGQLESAQLVCPKFSDGGRRRQMLTTSTSQNFSRHGTLDLMLFFSAA